MEKHSTYATGATDRLLPRQCRARASQRRAAPDGPPAVVVVFSRKGGSRRNAARRDQQPRRRAASAGRAAAKGPCAGRMAELLPPAAAAAAAGAAGRSLLFTMRCWTAGENCSGAAGGGRGLPAGWRGDKQRVTPAAPSAPLECHPARHHDDDHDHGRNAPRHDEPHADVLPPHDAPRPLGLPAERKRLALQQLCLVDQ